MTSLSYHSRQPSIASSMISDSTFATTQHPQKIGPWRLGKTLGRGATGRVLLAQNITNGQKAAVKVVSKSSLSEEDEETKKGADEAGLPYGIEREIIIMKLLAHPNVLRLYDVWETSKALYLVLEYVEGGELFDLLVERGPLPEEEAVQYFRQIVCGAAYCHALGICHRDLKPENLLLDGDFNVKLADFGMAALESNGRLLETSCGSPHYAAPEIVSGLKYHGATSDVWSCGVILFALLTGRLPFDDENIRNLLLKVQSGNFEMPRELGKEAKHLLKLMLTVDPMKRIKTEEILQHPLLLKYPPSKKDLLSFQNLPDPETAYRSLGTVESIDTQILQNLTILWHGRAEDEIIECLLKEGANPEKTFYALLLRYRHTHEGEKTPKRKSQMHHSKSTTSISSARTPKKNRMSMISVTSAKNRPISYLTSPQKSPKRRMDRFSNNYQFQVSPSKNYRSPKKSPKKSHPYSMHLSNSEILSEIPPIPKEIYDEAVAKDPFKQQNGKQYVAQHIQQPSVSGIVKKEDSEITIKKELQQDSIYYPTDDVTFSNISTTSVAMKTSISSKRLSRSNSRLSRRKSIRQSLTMRNSITSRVLATYANVSNESDWEYIDKSTKRTSASFATLIDKIFNNETYNDDDEKLVDEEEKREREYQRLMELEKLKMEEEKKLRKELERRKRKSKRKSLLSSKRLSYMIKDGGEPNGAVADEKENEPTESGEIQDYKNNNRSVSGPNPRRSQLLLTSADKEILKQRSITNPIQEQQSKSILTRRPVSKLDPLWTAYENEEIERAKRALEMEMQQTPNLNVSKKEKRKSKANKHKSTRNSYSVGTPNFESNNLSEQYQSEIKKSRLLNSQLGLKDQVKKEDSDEGIADEEEEEEEEEEEDEVYEEENFDLKYSGTTKISDVKIPRVTRKSKQFTNSNKRLSLMTMYSTRSSFNDLNSYLNPIKARTSHTFEERLSKVEDDEEKTDEENVGQSRRASGRPVSELPRLPTKPYRLSTQAAVSQDTLISGKDEHDEETKGIFKNIKLPDIPDSPTKDRSSKTKSWNAPNDQPKKNERAERAKKEYASLIPTTSANVTAPAQAPAPPPIQPPRQTGPAPNRKPLNDVTTENDQKRNRSIFRKLSFGSKKTMEDSKTNAMESTIKNEPARQSSIFRWFSRSEDVAIKQYKTTLGADEMFSALFSLLNSWSNYGVKNLEASKAKYIISGTISKNNALSMRSTKFQVKVNSREFNKKSELVCTKLRGSTDTFDRLVGELEKVLIKENVIDV